MTERRWTRTFADPAVLSDLFAAARDCMSEADECEPDECSHPEQLMTPVELAQWVEREVFLQAQRPTRFERGHRPKRMKDGDTRMSLAIAG